MPHEHQAILQRLNTHVPGPPGKTLALAGYRDKLNEVDDRIRRNADVLSSMAHFCHSFLGILEDNEEIVPRKSQPSHSVSDHDQDRVRTVLRQLSRDWSAEGAEERALAYDPIIQAVEARVPTSPENRKSVLIPGSGLGRLAFEFAMRGYISQGNEFSYFMLIPAHFILNCTHHVCEHDLFPYIHGHSNWRTADDMLQCVQVPDVLPSELPNGANFSMVAGEFVEVYAKAEERARWDVVATCYFIDTSKNLLRYLEVINAVLPVGGVWVNAGPLLWHFEHDKIPTLEFTLDEVLALVEACGFVIEEQKSLPAQTYTGIPHSMLVHHYVPAFWVCRKVRDHPIAPSV